MELPGRVVFTVLRGRTTVRDGALAPLTGRLAAAGAR
jgi:dihydroorotase-like cyclic amidohydrolase